MDRALVQSETTPFQHRMHSAVTFKTLHTGPDQDPDPTRELCPRTSSRNRGLQESIVVARCAVATCRVYPPVWTCRAASADDSWTMITEGDNRRSS